jgi:hypothetical protein
VQQQESNTLDIYRITGKSGNYTSGVRYGLKGRATAIITAAVEYATARKRKPEIKVERVTVNVNDWVDVTKEFVNG